MNRYSRVLAVVVAVVAAALAGCGSGGELTVQSTQVSGADETTGTLSAELASAVPVGSTLKATANVNLRTGPSTGYAVLRVIPTGASVVTVGVTSPTNGFYKVKHNGQIGWSHGGYYKLVSTPSTGTSTPRDEAITRAKSGVGFSYWWGHGRWLASGATSSNKGYCSGSCPSCSHSGSYGADCSGYIAKIWRIPSSNDTLSNDSHPYSTWNFVNETTAWHGVSRSNIKKADAMVYNSGGAGHMFLFESGSGWGSMWAYEAKGCSYGIVKNLRTATSAYKAIARNGW